MEYGKNHSHITGDFSEHLIMYWLSKNGYECVLARYLGIDIIATKDDIRMGISVKSRSRKMSQSSSKITISKPETHIQHVKNSCESFGCKEYFAFVLDQDNSIKGFLIPLESIIEQFGVSKASTQDWDLKYFYKDPRIDIFELSWV
ncbi:hypothetical protein AZ66_20390 [Paenibacillus sp. E194]|uniref:hypothetical protein n=1 Tax=Paenibacillus sp. E194 TaxID=1458845 RepID=UPI0005CAABF7|nr:hypothetical protein [Paenibacillus sp. E194]KJB86156.1 hypothetical protein AZ66_20390 [Paenibacillus sp. E194]